MNGQLLVMCRIRALVLAIRVMQLKESDRSQCGILSGRAMPLIVFHQNTELLRIAQDGQHVHEQDLPSEYDADQCTHVAPKYPGVLGSCTDGHQKRKKVRQSMGIARPGDRARDRYLRRSPSPPKQRFTPMMKPFRSERSVFVRLRPVTVRMPTYTFGRNHSVTLNSAPPASVCTIT